VNTNLAGVLDRLRLKARRGTERVRPRQAAIKALTLAVGLALATVMMSWLGYRSTREWQRSTVESAETRGNEVLAFLTVALERDMKGGQITVLLPFNQALLNTSTVYDLADRFAGGFARFPYVDSFFVWETSDAPAGVTYFFNRANRPPIWGVPGGDAHDLYPVVVHHDPVPMRNLIGTARQAALRGVPYVLFEESIAGVRYQTLAHLIYSGDAVIRLSGLVGLTVDIDWARNHYFPEFVRQIQDIDGDRTIGIQILDDEGGTVATVGPPQSGGSMYARGFPIVFADPELMSSLAPRYRAPQWVARVNITNEATVVAAGRGTTRTLGLLLCVALVTIAALALTVRTVRAGADLANLQSEFVSAVTHEMKTPLSLIRLASDALSNGHYSSPTTVTDYGQLLAKEATHLTQLIDNVLCYARLTDAKSCYSFERVDVLELIDDSMARFRLELADLGFDVHFHQPPTAPAVRADRAMMQHAIDNLIDNAVKHAASGRQLTVTVDRDQWQVKLAVTDCGEGIPPEELPRLFEKFYRGKGAKRPGSGLGLAIAKRIIEDHGGKIVVRSILGQGTSIEIALPTVTS
jgi:signal transduction histidine kinase